SNHPPTAILSRLLHTFLTRRSSDLPALDQGWNSGCTASNGLFAPNVSAAPHPVNCAAFVDPSAASLATGGGYVFGNLPTAVSWRSVEHTSELQSPCNLVYRLLFDKI